MKNLVYLGTIDDVTIRFPWKFPVQENDLYYSLICHYLTGNQVLINDGYLLNHPVARSALLNKDHLLRHLIKQGSVSIATRGYRYVSDEVSPERVFGLHEMPERMKKIKSFEDLISDRINGIPEWTEFRALLEIIDKSLADNGSYISWSPYSTTSGYIAFVDKLLDQNASPRSVGLSWWISQRNFHIFLKSFKEEMQSHPEKGPRDTWENIAKSFAEDPDVTNSTKNLLNGLMRLANEIYHYNFGVGLTAAYRCNVRVETQPSVAFDDLLLRRNVLVGKNKQLPYPFIHRSVVNIQPDKLVKSIENDGRLSEARRNYIEAVRRANSLDVIDADAISYINEMSGKYEREIYRIFGNQMQKGDLKKAFDFVFSETSSNITGEVLKYGAAAATFAASSTLGEDYSYPILASAAAYLGASYLLFRASERAKPVVQDMYNLFVDEIPNVDPRLVRQSHRFVRSIKHQKNPICLEIDRKFAEPIVNKMTLFTN